MAETPLSGYRTCTWCGVSRHDLCEGFAFIHHVGSDEPEVVKCECPSYVTEDTDTDPPLSWDPGDPGWAPTPAESAFSFPTENSENDLAAEVEELRGHLAAAVDVIADHEDRIGGK